MIKSIKIIYFIILSFYFLFFPNVNAQEKIKIGLLVPMTGDNKEIGKSIVKAVGLAVKNIDNDLIEIYPKDTATKANQTLKSAFELSQMGIKIVIGPVFYESLTYLDEMKELTFLSLTNKTLDLPKNVISAGVNAISQLNTIKKYLSENNLKNTVFLVPETEYKREIEDAIEKSNLILKEKFIYSKEVATLLRLSLKSAIITESKLIKPKVSFFFSFSIFLFLFKVFESSILLISSSKFCFLC